MKTLFNVRGGEDVGGIPLSDLDVSEPSSLLKTMKLRVFLSLLGR
ncbi:hypothetical protein [Bradyrhizobium sp. 35]|nr:hypothetical protein [Bradyrhizobium sp. 35]